MLYSLILETFDLLPDTCWSYTLLKDPYFDEFFKTPVVVKEFLGMIGCLQTISSYLWSVG